MPLTEKRQTQRTPLQTQGTVQLGPHVLDVRTQNISLEGSGVELSSSAPLEVGSSLRLKLPNPGIVADAIVRWARESTDGLLILGLQFENLQFVYQPINEIYR